MANQDGIPDSPPGNTNLQIIIDLDDDDTKSESPDLGQSLYDVPLSRAGIPGTGTELPMKGADDRAVLPAAGTEQLYTEFIDQAVPASFADSTLLISGSGVSLTQDTSSTQPVELRTPQPPTVAKDYPGTLSRPKQRLGSSLPRNPLRRNSLPNNPIPSVSKFGKELDDIYDPVETDTENTQKQPNPSSARRAHLRAGESVQSPSFNHAKAPLTNGEMRPPSINDETQSSATYVRGDQQPIYPLPEKLQRIPENAYIKASTTKLRTLMGPPEVAYLAITEKHQESSLKPLSQSTKAIEELGDTRIHLGRSASDVSNVAINSEPPITLEKNVQLPEKTLVEESMRSVQTLKEEAQQERLDRKRKREEVKTPSKMTAELESVAATQEAQISVMQAKETENMEQHSKAVGVETNEKKTAEQSKVKEARAKEQRGNLEAEKVKKQELTEEKKPKDTKVKEVKPKALEKDAKQSKPEPTTKLNGIQDPMKQTEQWTMATRTPGRKDSEAMKNRRAELSMQKVRESSVHERPKSLTPLSSSGSQKTKTKSLTAFIPGSVRSRSSSLSIEHPNSVQETPSRGTKAGERPPLTSALRKSPNALRRSVSISWANPIAPADASIPSKTAATASTLNGNKCIGSSPMTSASVTASHARQPSVEILRTSSTSSADTSQKKSRDPRKKTSTDTKKQTKLIVKRDVKQKGRVIDPPGLPNPVDEESLVISSDSDDTVSTFYSDPDGDVQEILKVKAGPSTKKKTKSEGKMVTAKAVITPKTPPDSQVDVAQQATVERAVRNIESAANSRQAKAVTPTKAVTPAKAVTLAKTLPGPQGTASQQAPVKRASPNTESATSSQQTDATDIRSKASSRSPAYYVSSSPSSTSGASAKSDASAVSSSRPGIAPEPNSQAPMEMKSTHVDSRRGSSNSVAPKDVKSTPAPDRCLFSQSSTTHSTQQTQNTETASVESALDQQLQREARQFSEPAQVQVKSTPPMTRSHAFKSNALIQATPAATPSEYPYTMSGPRPANFRYPSLTNLKNNPPRYDSKEHLKYANFMSSQKGGDLKPIPSSQTNGVNHDDESSSESDDESGSSSDNDDGNAAPNPYSSPMGSQLSKKSDGKNAKGLSSLFRRRFFTGRSD